MARNKPVPPEGHDRFSKRRLRLAAKVLFEAENGRTDAAAGSEHHVSARTVKRWRQHEAAGKLPDVTAELQRLRAAASDIVRSRAEQVLEQVYSFLERATGGDPKDPKMVEAMVKAGEFLYDTVTMAGMMNGVPRARTTAQDRTADQQVPGVGGGARPASGGRAGTGGADGASTPGTRVH